MQHELGAGADMLARREISYVTFDDPGSGPSGCAHDRSHFIEICLVTSREVVEPYDMLVQLQQFFEKVGANKARNTGHQPGSRLVSQRGLNLLIWHTLVEIRGLGEVLRSCNKIDLVSRSGGRLAW